MKIGLFTDTFYPEINGVATSCLNLQRELTRRGHDVHVYAPKCKGWEENQHENVHYLASAPLLVLKDRNFAFPTPLTSWEAEKIDFDVVHTNSEFVMGMFGHHVAGSLGCAQVHTYHTVWEDYTYYITHGVADETARKITRKYSQWWCNRFDRVITPTGKTLDLLRKYGVEAPIDIIPSGMDIARFDPARHDEAERLATRRECGLPERAPLLLNIGRIAKEKNLEQVMRVFPKLLNACPDVHFAIVGEGPMREDLGRMAEELGVSRAVNRPLLRDGRRVLQRVALGDAGTHICGGDGLRPVRLRGERPLSGRRGRGRRERHSCRGQRRVVAGRTDPRVRRGRKADCQNRSAVCRAIQHGGLCRKGGSLLSESD